MESSSWFWSNLTEGVKNAKILSLKNVRPATSLMKIKTASQAIPTTTSSKRKPQKAQKKDNTS